MAPASILVVDDDPFIRDMVSQALEFEGYVVQTAGDGREALDQIARRRPALVLLDMRMPVLDGWGFARELRARRIDLPIIVMTAAKDPDAWAHDVDAEACLAKPFDLVDLIDTVERFAPTARDGESQLRAA